MRKFLLILSILFLVTNVYSQDGNKITVVKGELIRITPKLTDLTPDPTAPNYNDIVRDRFGLISRRGVEPPEPTPFHDPTGLPLGKDPALQTKYGKGNPASPDIPAIIETQFNGIGFTNVAPADPTMCVGPNHIIQMANGSSGALFKIFDKNGNQVLAQTFLDQLPGAGFFGSGDPIALYDQLADRYILSEFGSLTNGGSVNQLIMCVSQTNDPTGAWIVYRFGNGSIFPDYPHWSIWNNAYYATTNTFNPGFVGCSMFAFDRTKMLAGDPTATMQTLLLNNFTGANRSLAPVSLLGNTVPPANSPGLFAYYNEDDLTAAPDVDSVGFFTFLPDFTTPANSVVGRIPGMVVAPFKSNVCPGRDCAPGCNGSAGYDVLSNRIMHHAYYRRFPGYDAITIQHTVDAGGGQAATRWYEFRNNGGGWAVHQQSTFAPDATNFRYMPSMAINAVGQICLGYNLSGNNVCSSIGITGRNESDPLNLMTYDENVATVATGYGTFGNRWGDYNDMNIDPVDDSVFWFTAMYGQANWNTRILKIKLRPLANCTLPVVTAPTVTQPVCPSPITGTIVVNATGPSTLEYSVNGGSTYQLSNTFSGLAPGSYNILVRVQSNPLCLTSYSGNPVIINPPNVATTTVSYTGPSVAIPDNVPAGVNINLPVSGLGASMTDINFMFDALAGCNATVANTNAAVDHTFVGDLVFKLTSPGGTTVTIMNSRGGTRENICNTLLDDDGGFPSMSTITSTTGQTVSGNFAPDSPLSAFDGQDPNGTWILNVSDVGAVDLGSLRRFSLIITASSPCTGGCTPPAITAPTVTQPTCTTASGTIVVNATGGGTLEYSINNGSSFQPSNTFSGLAPGSYNIVVRLVADPLCITNYSANPVIINVVPTLNVTAPTVTQPSCVVLTGTIVVNATGSGTLEYSINGGTSYQASNTFSGLAAGSYNIFVRLQGVPGCTSSYGGNPVVLTVATGCPCTLTCPANITVNNDPGQCGAIVTLPTATPVGTCGTLTYSPASGSFFPIGTTVVTVSSTFGTPCTFTVTVNDIQPPVITCPANITVSSTPDLCSGIATFAPPVITDNCTQPVSNTSQTWTNSGQRGVFFDIRNIGTSPIIITSVNPRMFSPGALTDVFSVYFTNAATTYLGNQTTAAAWTLNSTASVSTPGGAGITVQVAVPLATPLVLAPGESKGVYVVGTQGFGGGPVAYLTTPAYTGPQVYQSGSLEFSGGVGCSGLFTGIFGTGAPGNFRLFYGSVTYSPTYTQTAGLPSGSAFPVGTTTNTFTTTDGSGNSATCSFTVTVNDIQAPSITCPAAVNRATDPGVCTATFAPVNPTATDNCGVTLQTWAITGVTTATSPATGINTVGSRAFNIGVSTITYTIRDAAGNTNTCSQTITITDGQLPVITTQPANRTVCAGSNATFSVTAITAPTAGGPLSYQWQLWNGSTWNNIAGATAATLPLNSVTQTMNTNTYRVIVTGLCTPVTSGFATLFVNPLPTINLTTSIPPALLPTQVLTITATTAPAGGSYVWFKNGVVIPGATGNTLSGLTVDDIGSYHVVYTDANGCVTTSSTIEITGQPSENLYVYPVPNQGVFNVRFYNQSNEQVTVRVFDTKGAEVYNRKVLTTIPYTTINVDLSTTKPVANGTYVVEVRGADGKLMGSRKVIVYNK